ncbi:MAG: hypothetical protein K0S07_1222 [Chlamydiales bacterium]|nr:hypothetical protein [Chlamydiales bacterium]
MKNYARSLMLSALTLIPALGQAHENPPQSKAEFQSLSKEQLASKIIQLSSLKKMAEHNAFRLQTRDELSARSYRDQAEKYAEQIFLAEQALKNFDH